MKKSAALYCFARLNSMKGDNNLHGTSKPDVCFVGAGNEVTRQDTREQTYRLVFGGTSEGSMERHTETHRIIPNSAI